MVPTDAFVTRIGWKPWSSHQFDLILAFRQMHETGDEAGTALQKSRELLSELPRVGAYEYERDCVEQLSAAIAVSAPRLAAA